MPRIKEPYIIVIYDNSNGLEWHRVIAEAKWLFTTEHVRPALLGESWETYCQVESGARTTITHNQCPVRVNGENLDALSVLQLAFNQTKDLLRVRQENIYAFLFPKVERP